MVELTNDGPDDDCRLLADSLLNIGYQQMKAKGRPFSALINRNLGHGYVMAFAGDAVADHLGLRDNLFKYVPALTRPLAVRADRRRRKLSPAELVTAACAYADEGLSGFGAAEIVEAA